MKIELPDSLHHSLSDSLVQMDEALKAKDDLLREITDTICKYEAEDRDLTAKVANLKRQILDNPDAAEKIPALALRSEALCVAIAETREKLKQVPPVKLYHQTAVLREVVEHWGKEIPRMFVERVGALFARRESAIQMANSSDAVHALRPLSHNAVAIVEAKPESVDYIRTVFNRALRGQVNLLAESSDTEAAG
jgi:hypothetical protein